VISQSKKIDNTPDANELFADLHDENVCSDEIAIKDFVQKFCKNARSAKLRSIIEFAEEEIRLPRDGGPHEGQRFKRERQPYVELLYNQFMLRKYAEFIICGPSQSGKTLSAFVVIIAYVVAELRTNMVIAVPDLNMVDNKWQIDILPVFRESPLLASLLPVKGVGSPEGGKVKDSVTFQNGVTIKFMTKGGSDQSKAGFTAPIVAMTEAAGFSENNSGSSESDPFRQFKARQRATKQFLKGGKVNTKRQFFAEGTCTNEDELPWRARIGSTKSRIVCQCKDCKEWVTPEREHLVGWQEASDQFEAVENAVFICPSCACVIDEDAREKMNSGMRLLHDGQEIDAKGNVKGKEARSARLWFRWNAFNNLFQSIGDIASEEWSNAQIDEDDPDRLNGEKDLMQSVWATPYVPPSDATRPLDKSLIAVRTGSKENLKKNEIPADTKHLAIGVDIGRWKCWYFAIAFQHDRMHVPFYGSWNTSLTKGGMVEKKHERVAIVDCLIEMTQFFESFTRKPDAVWIDSGYMPDAVFEACRRTGSGMRNRYKPIIGRGKTTRDKRKYSKPSRIGNEVRRAGNGWHLSYVPTRKGWQATVDVDTQKFNVQRALRNIEGQAGALTLFDAPPHEHKQVSAHLASEFFKRWQEPDGSWKEEWFQTGHNHLLDCAAYAMGAGDFLGWSIPADAYGETNSETLHEHNSGVQGNAQQNASSVPKNLFLARLQNAKSSSAR